MASEADYQLYLQSKLKDVERFWSKLTIGLNRKLVNERILDIGCNFPEFFFFLIHEQPDSIDSYVGVEKLEEDQIDAPLSEERLSGDSVYEKYKGYAKQILRQKPLADKSFENAFKFNWGQGMEELVETGFDGKYTLIFLRNVLHFIHPKHDKAIIDFILSHLDEVGIVYIEAHKEDTTICHGRPFPFDRARREVYGNAFDAMYEYGERGKFQILMH